MSSVEDSHGSAVTQARFDFQLKMLEAGAAEVQSQISRLDELLFKLKASFVTVLLWLAVPF